MSYSNSGSIVAGTTAQDILAVGHNVFGIVFQNTSNEDQRIRIDAVASAVTGEVVAAGEHRFFGNLLGRRISIYAATTDKTFAWREATANDPTEILTQAVAENDNYRAPSADAVFGAIADAVAAAPTKSAYKFTYDFGVSAGAVGTIPLTAADGTIPDDFIITNILLEVLTALTSDGSATAALTTTQTANDIVTAAVVSGAPWSTTGRKATTVVAGTVASSIKTTTARTPALVVAVADLTAGKLNIFVEGFQSE